MSQQFKREERYIVIKLKDLGGIPDHLRHEIVNAIKAAEFPQRECVVVESDWPEYAPTWAAIERRMTGQPTLVDSREQFEQAYSEDNGGVPVAFLMSCRQGDSYTVPKVARAWYWWKRARAGVVVVLPDLIYNIKQPECRIEARGYNYGVNAGHKAGLADAAKAIEAAGVKVAT